MLNFNDNSCACSCPNGEHFQINVDYPVTDSEIDRIKLYIFHNRKNENEVYLYGNFQKISPFDPLHTFVNITKDMIDAWYPQTLSETIDLILLYLYNKMNYYGEKIEVTYLDLLDICFIEHCDIERNVDLSLLCPKKYKEQINYLISYLIKSNYIENFAGSHVNGPFWKSKEQLQLTITGLSRVDDFLKKQIHNKKVFIAMSFNPAINNIYHAIVSAVKQAECEVVSMKGRIHNKQIVPEMLRLIRESKMLVMDISEPNFGAYYEAGYAQGLNKEVIITCKDSVMKKEKFLCKDNDDKECEFLKKYSKPHFDIAQKQILVWEDEADLTEQLTEWIKFLIG